MKKETRKQTFKLSEYDGMIREVLNKDGHFRMYPRGTSMLPLIRQEIDSVVLVKADGDIKVGEIAFYLRDDGHYVLHRIVGKKTGAKNTGESVSNNNDSTGEHVFYTMCGDNQLKREEGIRRDQIIGVVECVYRKEKEVSGKNVIYRLYVLLWKSFFIRRVYFKLRSIRNRLTK